MSGEYNDGITKQIGGFLLAKLICLQFRALSLDILIADQT
jgi:hypothetical protein